MPRHRTYYLGRVNKMNLEEADFLQAILDPVPTRELTYTWTLIDT